MQAANRACEILKACRHSWLSLGEIATLIDATEHATAAWVYAMADHGLLDRKHEAQGRPGRWPMVFRVSDKWRNE